QATANAKTENKRLGLEDFIMINESSYPTRRLDRKPVASLLERFQVRIGGQFSSPQISFDHSPYLIILFSHRNILFPHSFFLFFAN
ncbi:MAG TPA: hypothetical protein DCG39_08705, partial [Opitutae bacterium]|nr:hypothetical protein [Opitutae bacterium]